MEVLPAVVIEAVALDKLCPFELSPGVNCNSRKVFARGYCEKHYRSLKRAGAFDADIQTKTPRQQVTANVTAIRKARKKLLKLAPDFVDHLHTGSRIAAQNGKTDAAQWALLHTRVIEPVSDKTSSAPIGTTINIGVKVSGVEGR